MLEAHKARRRALKIYHTAAGRWRDRRRALAPALFSELLHGALGFVFLRLLISTIVLPSELVVGDDGSVGLYAVRVGCGVSLVPHADIASDESKVLAINSCGQFPGNGRSVGVGQFGCCQFAFVDIVQGC